MQTNEYVDKAISAILNPIMKVIEVIITFIFSNKIIAILVYLIGINLLSIILVKKDKKYAKNDKWRIKESTLLITAMVGGSLGLYYAMHKYRHKTLHKKFTVGVPIIIIIQIAIVIFSIFNWLFL